MEFLQKYESLDKRNFYLAFCHFARRDFEKAKETLKLSSSQARVKEILLKAKICDELKQFYESETLSSKIIHLILKES